MRRIPSNTTSSFFFFNDTATTEIYTLSLHDALPISRGHPGRPAVDHPRRLLPPRVRSERGREVEGEPPACGDGPVGLHQADSGERLHQIGRASCRERV